MNKEDYIEPYVCRELTQEEIRHEPCFRARLSDGSAVYSKVGRQSWLELKAFLRAENTGRQSPLFITGLYFSFRDHTEEVASGPYEGYFLTLGALSWYGTGVTQHLLIGGYLQERLIYRKKYILPEIVLQEQDIFPANTPEMQRGLILRNKI